MYTISSIRPGPGTLVVYEVITDSLRRLYVTIPRKHTDTATVDQIITTNIAALTPHHKPFL